ncbi:MAG TPA: hypothetical protein VFX25_25185, partial [Streptosporangiaceae bacterium]|nr:hypothetical protein [Streptosporangiaceae bacterium]
LVVAAAAGRPAEAAAPARPAAAVTLARATLTARIVPAAAAAPARPGTPAAEAIPLPGTGGCGLLDFGCDVSNAITSWFAGLVKSAVSPLLSLIGRTALSTPQPGSVAAVRTLWSTGLGIADACYGLLVLVGGIIVMTHETLQTSYSAKEIAPRIVIGFVTANLSMVLMSKAIDLANGLSAAFTAGGVSPQSAATSLMTTLGNAISSNGIFLILLALAGVILALVLAAVYVIRLMAVVLLAAAAPLCLALYCLPQTAWAARWWWRALTAALAIQVAQGLVMTAAVQVFFSPGWLPGDIGSTLGQTLITLCLLYILMRIPFWIARPVLSPFGRSPLRRAARFVVTAAILSRVGPLLRGTGPASRGTAARTVGGTRAGARRAPGTGSSGWSWQASPAPPPAPGTPPGVAGPPARPAGGRPLPPAPPSPPSGP